MEINLTGRKLSGAFASKLYPRATFDYTVYLPQTYDATDNCGLLVTHDGLNELEAYVLDILAQTGEAPCCVSVGVKPGILHPETGCDRNLRMNTYDMFLPEYPNFVIDELLPYLFRTYNLRVSPSPDMHLISGGSSGGCSAWNIAWHRSDWFHRVCLSSPSFLSMGKTDELIRLIRKCEPKPLRVYTAFSEHEPDDYFGSSFCAADAAYRALKFAGYDVLGDYFPGEGHCSRNVSDVDSALKRMRFLWKDWRTVPVTVKDASSRIRDVIPPDEGWEHSDTDKNMFAVPERFAHRYIAESSRILLDGKIIADGFDKLTALTVSSDGARLYIGDLRRGCVYAATILSDGSLDGIYTHAVLHLPTDFRYPGVFSLCVDCDDRLYASTESGIQTIRSYGLIDVILDNPTSSPPTRLGVGTDGYLYAYSNGVIFRRRLNGQKCPDAASKPQCVGYYDHPER